MQVCGAFCSGYWALKPFGSRIASVLRTSATAYAVYMILSLNARVKSNTRSARA